MMSAARQKRRASAPGNCSMHHSSGDFGKAALAIALLALFAGGASAEDMLRSADPTADTPAMHDHDQMGAIDPAALPGKPTRSLESTTILRAPDGKGHETIVNRTIRAPGTRAPIHFHDAGGTTCVLEGEMTLYLEGQAPQRAVAGQCYFMPSGKPMSGVNSGSVNAVLLDIFTVPLGTPVWRVTEDGMAAIQQQFPKPQQ